MSRYGSFLLRGDSGTNYRISIGRGKRGICLNCSCPAGEKGQLCKHRLRLLQGMEKDVLNASQESLALLHQLAAEPEVQADVTRIAEIERAQVELKKELAALKKRLGKMLNGS